MARCLSTYLITSGIAPLIEALYLSIIDFNIWVDSPSNSATPLSNLSDFFSRSPFHFSAFLASYFQKLWAASLFFSFIFLLTSVIEDYLKLGDCLELEDCLKSSTESWISLSSSSSSREITSLITSSSLLSTLKPSANSPVTSRSLRIIYSYL